MDSGVTGCCGRIASLRATCLVVIDWIAAPSMITVPCLGRSSRARARKMVDLPDPFGPRNALTLPSGMCRDTWSTMGAAP